MNGRKSFTLEAIGFAFKSLVEHVRLFVIVLLIGTGLISLVVGIIAFLNKGFIQTIMTSQALRDYQECIGYNCATVAYQSGATLMSLVSANFFSLLISAIILMLFFVGLDLGFKKIALALHDRNDSSYKELVSCFGLAPKAFIGWALYCVMVWVGWLIFVLPGFIALLRFAFFPYFIIDKNMGPIDALKRSYEVTTHHMWDIFALWVAMKILVSLGFVSWMGVMITWPLSTLAYAFFYRKLVTDNNNQSNQYKQNKMY
ncbi:MAG TPA: hypothetical protein VJJ26_02455 [Candidatus Babeliales bacterium]|nr:hypothetical protein [Candidatus Babeliales bacterium]